MARESQETEPTPGGESSTPQPKMEHVIQSLSDTVGNQAVEIAQLRAVNLAQGELIAALQKELVEKNNG